jgi:hypothetical protein
MTEKSFEVTDAMVSAAIKAQASFEAKSLIAAGGWRPNDAMRAAITAAIEASGILEENARLRAFAAEVEVECNGHFNCDLTAEEAIDNIRKELEALNKEPAR